SVPGQFLIFNGAGGKEAFVQRLNGCVCEGSESARIYILEPAQRAFGSELSSFGFVPAGGSRFHTRCSCQLGARRDQRRILGRLSQRRTSEQDLLEGVVQNRCRHSLQSAGKSLGSSRSRILGKRSGVL